MRHLAILCPIEQENYYAQEVQDQRSSEARGDYEVVASRRAIFRNRRAIRSIPSSIGFSTKESLMNSSRVFVDRIIPTGVADRAFRLVFTSGCSSSAFSRASIRNGPSPGDAATADRFSRFSASISRSPRPTIRRSRSFANDRDQGGGTRLTARWL